MMKTIDVSDRSKWTLDRASLIALLVIGFGGGVWATTIKADIDRLKADNDSLKASVARIEAMLYRSDRARVAVRD